MALYRLRARVRYPKSSGLAIWSRDQMDVRYGQSVFIKEGLNNEEAPQNNVVDDPDDPTNYEIFTCDLPLHDQAAADDAFVTLTDPTVFGQAENFGVGEEASPSWIENHVCRHDETPQQPCHSSVKSTPTNIESGDEWQAGVSYSIDDIVTYNEIEYICIQAHTSQEGWEPPNTPSLWNTTS